MSSNSPLQIGWLSRALPVAAAENNDGNEHLHPAGAARVRAISQELVTASLPGPEAWRIASIAHMHSVSVQTANQEKRAVSALCRCCALSIDQSLRRVDRRLPCC